MDSQALRTGIAQVGKEIRAVVSFGKDSQIFSITKRQREFLSAFLETGNFELACEKGEVAKSTAANWFRDKKFKAFILERLQMAAKVNGYGFNRWLGKMIDIFEGEKDVKAGEVIAKALGYIRPEMGVIKNEFRESAVEIVYKFEGKGGPEYPHLATQNPADGGSNELRRFGAGGGQEMGQNGIRYLQDDRGNAETK